MVGPVVTGDDWETALDQQGGYWCKLSLSPERKVQLFSCHFFSLSLSLPVFSPLSLPQEKLVEFILASQDEETGGFADRPGDWVS